jgi:phytoene dehydrogenase-like protein
MAFIPNLRRRKPVIAASETASTQQATFGYIDTLFDYGAFLAASPALGTLPASGQTIAIIGAGMGGLVSAYELLRAGASNVVLYEASGRIGGRAYSIPFTSQAPAFLAEMGAMRFPPSEYSLFHYLDQFGIEANSNFPDPGERQPARHVCDGPCGLDRVHQRRSYALLRPGFAGAASHHRVVAHQTARRSALGMASVYRHVRQSEFL